jgi:transcriptional regulator with XRE-family HTH domain
MTITTAQIRGARGILDWSQSDLSERTGMSPTSLSSIEKGITQPRDTSIRIIQKAFEDEGIEFIGGDGVKIKSGEIRTYRGSSGFWGFYEDIYRTCMEHHGDVCVSNVNERKFLKWLGEDNLAKHKKRMSEIEGLRYKILVKENDDYFVASEYAEYRWIDPKLFASVPFYVYGNKLAILLFGNEVEVIVLDYPSIAETYKIQFNSLWGDARTLFTKVNNK